MNILIIPVRHIIKFGDYCRIKEIIGQRVQKIVCLFIKNNRFGIIFGGLFFIHVFIWWLAFWPGIFNFDCFRLWDTAHKIEAFNSAFGMLNLIITWLTIKIIDHPFPILFGQIACMSVLCGCIFQKAVKCGVRLKWCILLFLFIFCSLPILLYTLSAYRDGAMGIVSLFWMYWLFSRMIERQTGTRREYTYTKAALLGVFLCLSCLVRPNAEPVIFIIIFLSIVSGILPKTKIITLGVTAISLFFFLGKIVFPIIAYNDNREVRMNTYSRICRLEMNSGVAENEQWRRFGMNARVVSG